MLNLRWAELDPAKYAEVASLTDLTYAAHVLAAAGLEHRWVIHAAFCKRPETQRERVELLDLVAFSPHLAEMLKAADNLAVLNAQLKLADEAAVAG